MIRNLALVAICLAFASGKVLRIEPREKDLDNWWTHTIVYQIYPRSFQDSDGDGTGDLKGIESRLDHFVDIGVETIWLSPIYKSPMKDFGYDISDFRDIDPIFGTLDDFKSLLASAKDRNIKVILDFVPNHSSDEHEWFLKSVAREDPYTDYYVWADPKGIDDDGNPIPPNNWISIFRGPAWEYNEARGQFYLHQFVPGQPDLNYRNEMVRQEMKQVLTYWLDLGVDGFRMDAVPFLAEDPELRDEPLSGNSEDPNDYGYLDHIYTMNLPETREWLAEFYDVVKAYGEIDGHDRVDMLEAYISKEELLEYYKFSDYPFNFGMIFYEEATADRIYDAINDQISQLPEGKTANWVLGNHDQWRIGSRTKPELIDAFNIITMTLPGVAVTYNGEEIGMVNNFDISFEDSVDPQGCNCGPDHYADPFCSRDFERTPMQWTGSEKNAGFSEADKTWLPVNENYQTVNVESEKEDPNSHLNIYKQVVALRYSDPAFDVGVTSLTKENNVLAFSRTYDPVFYPTFVTVANFNGEATNVNFGGAFNDNVDTGVVLISSSGRQGESVDLSNLTMEPYEAIVVYLFATK